MDTEELKFGETKTNRTIIKDTLDLCFTFKLKAKIKTDASENIFEVLVVSDIINDGKIERKVKDINTGKEEKININDIKGVAKEEKE